MKKHSLSAQKRDSFGRQVKKLRKQDLIPGTIYGKKVKSQSVSVATKDFTKTYEEVGETGLVELKLADEIRPVLIHNVQRSPIDESILHVEFFQVDLKEKVKAHISLEFVGESPVVAQKQGVFLTVLDELEVEALPADLPEKLEVDISGLKEVNRELKVSDLKIPSRVAVLTESSLTIAKIGSLVSKEAEAEAAAEAAAAAAAQAVPVEATAPAEGEKPAEPTEEAKPSEKPVEPKKEEKPA